MTHSRVIRNRLPVPFASFPFAAKRLESSAETALGRNFDFGTIGIHSQPFIMRQAVPDKPVPFPLALNFPEQRRRARLKRQREFLKAVWDAIDLPHKNSQAKDIKRLMPGCLKRIALQYGSRQGRASTATELPRVVTDIADVIKDEIGDELIDGLVELVAGGSEIIASFLEVVVKVFTPTTFGPEKTVDLSQLSKNLNLERTASQEASIDRAIKKVLGLDTPFMVDLMKSEMERTRTRSDATTVKPLGNR